MNHNYDTIFGDDEEDTILLREMAKSAVDWVLKFKWCKSVKSIKLDIGIGGIVGAFFVEIEPESNDIDSKFWIIFGDIPPAYLVTEMINNGSDAIKEYCFLMEEWCNAVNNGMNVDNLIPVNVPPTKEWAEKLKIRIDLIRKSII